MTASAPALVTGQGLVAGRPPLDRLVSSAALFAATTLATAMAWLAIAHLAGGMRFGDGTQSPIVNGLQALTAIALLPIPFAIHRRLGAADPRASAASVALAVDAIVFGAVLHALFALGVVSFEAASPLVLIGYLAFAGWLWIVGSLGSATGRLPHGRRMAVVAATIVGLPLWLVWVARRIEE